MKTIDNLNIAPERVLNDEELIQLKGGKDQYICYCKNGPGVWYGYYNSYDHAKASVAVYCVNSGGKGDCNQMV